MQSTRGTQSLLQPATGLPPDVPSGIGVARMLGENALLTFPPEAFEEEVVTRRFLGRRQIILNRPAAIQHILIDNQANYRRTTPTMRMLLPLLGRGLLLSDGEDWKAQRRTAAPAFAPRTIPALARHFRTDATPAIMKQMTTEIQQVLDQPRL